MSNPAFNPPWPATITANGAGALFVDGHDVGTMYSAKFAAELARRYNTHEQLVEALNAIANCAGNLPDDRLTSRTGANDAAHRGQMLANARRYARAALAAGEGR